MNQNEITLEALRKKKLQTEIEENRQVEEVEEINKKVETISEEDRNKINSLKTNINLLDSEVSTTYGVAAQKNLSTFSDTILNNIEIFIGGYGHGEEILRYRNLHSREKLYGRYQWQN